MDEETLNEERLREMIRKLDDVEIEDKIPMASRFQNVPVLRDVARINDPVSLKNRYLIKLNEENRIKREKERDRIAKEMLKEEPADYKQYSKISENITLISRTLSSAKKKDIVFKFNDAFRAFGDKKILETFLKGIEGNKIKIKELDSIFTYIDYYFSRAVYSWKEGKKPKVLDIEVPTKVTANLEDLSFITKIIPNSKLNYSDDSLIIKIIF